MPALDKLISDGAPQTYDLVVRDGDNISLALGLNNPDTTAFDLTGVTGTCSVRADYVASTDIVTATVSIPTPANGAFFVTLTQAQTATIAGTVPGGVPPLQLLVNVGVYDVVLTDSANQVTIVTGAVIVSRDVTA